MIKPLTRQVHRARGVQGFTLIELLVVISIIGALAGLLLANMVGVRSRAADTKRKNDLRQMKTALQLYFNDYQAYPTSAGGVMYGCGSAGNAACSVGGEFSAGGNMYMKELPLEFEYYSDGVDEYIGVTTLESTSDEDAVMSQDKCDPESKVFFGGSVTDSEYVVCED